MLKNTSKTLGIQKIMVYKFPLACVCVWGGGGVNYIDRGLTDTSRQC